MKDITLFIPLGRDISLLERNLDHYTEMGVQRILLSVHLRPEWEEGFLGSINAIISKYPAIIAETYTGSDNPSKTRYENVVKNFCGPDDWIIVADLDEFYEYSRPLPEIIEYCLIKGYDYVTGEFLDRVGPEGNLPDIKGNLWDAFPVGLQLTKTIANGCTHKVVLSRTSIGLSTGHHRALSGIHCPKEEISAIVHHFKWDSTCIERLQYMVGMYERHSLPWSEEPKRILQFLKNNNGRFTIDLPQFEAYWPSYKRGNAKEYSGLQSIWHDPNKILPRRLDTLSTKIISTSDFLICGNSSNTLRLSYTGMLMLDLCNGFNSVEGIVSILNEAYPSTGQIIEYETQSTIRTLYAAGFITETPKINSS